MLRHRSGGPRGRPCAEFAGMDPGPEWRTMAGRHESKNSPAPDLGRSLCLPRPCEMDRAKSLKCSHSILRRKRLYGSRAENRGRSSEISAPTVYLADRSVFNSTCDKQSRQRLLRAEARPRKQASGSVADRVSALETGLVAVFGI